jgi:ABC-type uncharacterized transport system ATPase subunit
VHRRILEERSAGKAVLLVSFELEEVMSLADRILVIYEGEIVKEFEAGRATVEDLGFHMTGGGKAGERAALSASAGDSDPEGSAG